VDVLALYDIHGNIDALEAVLSDPRAAGADVVVVGGDAVPDPFAGPTLARLEALSLPVRWTRGNGEREVAEAVGGPVPAEDDLAGRTAALTAAELGDERARALGDLELTLELDGVLYCHATPRRDDEMLTRLSAPDRWAEALVDPVEPIVVTDLRGARRLAALGTALAVEVGQRAHGRPVGVRGHGRPALRLPALVRALRRVLGRLRAPEQAPQPTRHLHLAAPRVLLLVGHVTAPFARRDPRSRRSRSASGAPGHDDR
jgi:Calcineurin-like phosphoesterase